jgi:hypothetical protein
MKLTAYQGLITEDPAVKVGCGDTAKSQPVAVCDCDTAHLYLEANVEEETLKKVVWHSVATALANMVFPVPGGPNRSNPCTGEPSLLRGRRQA